MPKDRRKASPKKVPPPRTLKKFVATQKAPVIAITPIARKSPKFKRKCKQCHNIIGTNYNRHMENCCKNLKIGKFRGWTYLDK